MTNSALQQGCCLLAHILIKIRTTDGVALESRPDSDSTSSLSSGRLLLLLLLLLCLFFESSLLETHF